MSPGLLSEHSSPLRTSVLGAEREALEGVRGLLVEVDTPLVPGAAKTQGI